MVAGQHSISLRIAAATAQRAAHGPERHRAHLQVRAHRRTLCRQDHVARPPLHLLPVRMRVFIAVVAGTADLSVLRMALSTIVAILY